MEFRGEPAEKRGKGRPAIARRSCDQCRSRKIGCDRGSPCSNCVSARLECVHSAVTTNATTPKQRVLISAQYEQKIDGIAKDIDGIKLLLQRLNLPQEEKQSEAGSTLHSSLGESVRPPKKLLSVCTPHTGPTFSHSAHILDFVKAIVSDSSAMSAGPEANEILSSLKNLVHTLEHPVTARELSWPDTDPMNQEGSPSMPHLEAVVTVLRWAKDHEKNTRITWISWILPLQKFTEICQKVYFAVEDYNEVDFIIANGYLSYIFFENFVVSGRREFYEYCQICRRNLHRRLTRLPLLLPASMELIAALTLGAFNAIESSKAIIAWTFISTAASHCMTLGYHRLESRSHHDPALQATQERLFWAVHRLDKSISIRLGRPPNIRDDEITLPYDPDEPRSTKVARIQGKVYDQLYSPMGLYRPNDERSFLAEVLATEMRELIQDKQGEIASVNNQPDLRAADPMRVTYLHGDLVCMSSQLALIHRAISPAPGSLSGIIDDCVSVARQTLDIHEKCIMDVRQCKNDPLVVTRYINWMILNCPFVPFSILFTHAIQTLDATDLARLDRFVTSLQPQPGEEDYPDTVTHPYRLYKLLTQAAHLHFDLNAAAVQTDPRLLSDFVDLDFVHFEDSGEGIGGGGLLEAHGSEDFGLSDWFLGNQQLMNLLDENAMY